MRVYDDHVLIFCDTNHLTIWKEWEDVHAVEF
jgi:hypothetical protein